VQADNPGAVLITGASGRLGKQLGAHLNSRGYRLRALVRDAQSCVLPDYFEAVLDWKSARADSTAVDALLSGVASIVHLASSGASDEQALDAAHLGVPQLLLDAANKASVAKFIALSSIKAIAGEAHALALGPGVTPAPTSDYGVRKLQAEALLRDHCANSQLATYTLRLPMVYGADCIGNFGALCKAARWRLPIPVAADNQRSTLYIENLFSGIGHLLASQARPGHQLFHLADREAVSSKAFFQLIAQAQGSSGWCLTLPSRLAQVFAKVPVVGGISDRLLGSLRFEAETLNNLPDWHAPYSTAEGVNAAIQSKV